MPQPKIALCQLSFPDTTFSEDIEIALGVGAEGISVAETKIEPGRESFQQGELEAAGIAVALGVPATWTILPPLGGTVASHPEDPEKRIALIVESIRLLADFRPSSIFVCTGPAGSRKPHEATAIVTEGLRAAGEAASAAGVRLSVEPMRETMRSVRTIVCSLSETVDLLEAVGRDDIGIVFDTWHLWDSADVHEVLPHVVDKIHAVQIADYRQPTRTHMDRVLAGDGVIDFQRLFTQLREGGFEGWYDLEIFSDDGRFGTELEDSLWKLPPLEFARRQVDAFLRSWEAA